MPERQVFMLQLHVDTYGGDYEEETRGDHPIADNMQVPLNTSSGMDSSNPIS